MGVMTAERQRDKELMQLLAAILAAGKEGFLRKHAIDLLMNGRDRPAAKKQLDRLIRVARQKRWVEQKDGRPVRYGMSDSGRVLFERASPMSESAARNLQTAFRLVDARLRALLPGCRESFDEVDRLLSLHAGGDAAMPVRFLAPSTLESTHLDEEALGYLETIREAFEGGFLLRFKYRSKRSRRAADAEPKLVDPLGLVLHGERIYLAGRNGESRADANSRVWRLSGLVDVMVASARSPLSAADRVKALDAFLSDGLPLESPLEAADGLGMLPQTIELRVHQGVLGASGREMFSQHFNELELRGWVWTELNADDGGFTCELERPVTEEFYRWLFGYQPMIEVLRPRWLRERLVKDLEASLVRHRGPGVASA